MYKKFEIKIKGGCQSGRKGVTHNSKSDLPPNQCKIYVNCKSIYVKSIQTHVNCKIYVNTCKIYVNQYKIDVNLCKNNSKLM